MDTNAPAPKPDMLEQAGKVLKLLATCEPINDFIGAALDNPPPGGTVQVRNDERTVVLASAVLAVAAELRDIHNVLHEINMKMAVRE